MGLEPIVSRQTVGRISHSPMEPQKEPEDPAQHLDGFKVSISTCKGAILAFGGSPQLFSTSRLKYHVSPEPTLNKAGLLLLQVGAFSLRFSKLYPQFLIQLGYSLSTVITMYVSTLCFTWKVLPRNTPRRTQIEVNKLYYQTPIHLLNKNFFLKKRFIFNDKILLPVSI